LFDPAKLNPATPGSEIFGAAGALGGADFTATTSRQLQVALKMIW
jgi:hypothetical protein